MTKEDTGILIRGARLTKIAKEARRGLPHRLSPGVHFCTQWRKAIQSQCRTMYIVSSLGHLTETKELSQLRECEGPVLRFLAFVGELPVESIPQHLCRLGIRSDKRVHLAQVHETDAIRSLLTRVLRSLYSPSTEEVIADAWWEGDQLVVLSPSFERLRVPVGSLPAKLRQADREIQEGFQIDPYGDFLYWPQVDVHMGWEQFVQAVNPMVRIHAEQKSEGFNVRYGHAIRHLREASNMKQSGIEGLDERTVRRIEQGETRATANAIAKFAKAHGMDASQYMAEVSRYL